MSGKLEQHISKLDMISFVLFLFYFFESVSNVFLQNASKSHDYADILRHLSTLHNRIAMQDGISVQGEEIAILNKHVGSNKIMQAVSFVEKGLKQPKFAVLESQFAKLIDIQDQIRSCRMTFFSQNE